MYTPYILICAVFIIVIIILYNYFYEKLKDKKFNFIHRLVLFSICFLAMIQGILFLYSNIQNPKNYLFFGYIFGTLIVIATLIGIIQSFLSSDKKVKSSLAVFVNPHKVNISFRNIDRVGEDNEDNKRE